jgi:hypothetical protein
MSGDGAEYQELVKLYGSYEDEELLTLGRSMADLTETAQMALQGEMTRRGLRLTEPARPAGDSHLLSEEEMATLRSYAALAPPECVFEFGDGQGASAAYRALEVEGIGAVVLSWDGMSLDQRGPRVVVAPEDASRAQAVLAQPLLERFRGEEEDSVGEFDLPPCPRCGGGETLLEAADAVNHWRCDDCGHGWTDRPDPVH